MRNLALAIATGITAVVYAEWVGLLPLFALVVLAAVLVTGIDGVEIDLPALLGHAVAALLGVKLVCYFWAFFVVLAILSVPVLIVLSILSLGTVPYPRLPPRR